MLRSVTLKTALLVLCCLFLITWTMVSFFRGLLSLNFGPQRLDVDSSMAWQEVVDIKRRHIREKIPIEWRLDDETIHQARFEKNPAGPFLERLLDPQTLLITSQDAVDLADNLSRGVYTAVQVTEAFCKRSVIGHQLVPFLLDFDYDLALSQAKELDRYFKQNGHTVGPLHGLPVSFKDQYHVEGLETTMGYVGWVGTFEGQKDDPRYLHFESQIVRELRALGAIPWAKTTLAQTLRSGETNNNILGYLHSPVNSKLTAGGSSGGEGAIAAFRGSAFGFGTDSGGSVSMPAAYNGVYSLKPSFQRLPWNGIPTNTPGQTAVPTVPGIVGPSIRTIRRVLQALLSIEPWREDAGVLKMPWRVGLEQSVQQKQLVLGMLRSDGIVAPHPPMMRALEMTSQAMGTAGHKILPWNPPSHNESSDIHKGIINADGMPEIVRNIRLSGEPFVPEVAQQFPAGEEGPPSTILAYEKMAVRLERYRQAYHEYWQATSRHTDTGRPVDAVIFPVGPHSATLPGKSYWWTYTSVLNVLDYCAVVVPVTYVDKDIDKFEDTYQPLNEKDKLNWQAYDPEVFHGAPVSIMVVGRRLQEEKILAVADVVVDALVKNKKPASNGIIS